MSPKSAIYRLISIITLSLIVGGTYYRNFDIYDNAIDPNMLYITGKSEEKNNIIFIGGSRILRSVNPLTIQSETGLKAYNLALDGSSIAYFNMSLRTYIATAYFNMSLRTYIATHPRPDYVFINADFMSMDQSFLVYNYPDYFPFLDDTTVAQTLEPYCSYYAPDKKLDRWIARTRMISSKPDEQKIENLKNIFLGSKRYKGSVQNYRGYQPGYNQWGDMPGDTSTHNIIPYHSEGFDILQGMIRECKKDSIKVILLATPMYRDYRIKIANYQQFIDTMSVIAQRYQVPYWNYIDLLATDSTIYYYNIEHLNFKGADLYSSILANDIKNYISDSSFIPKPERIQY